MCISSLVALGISREVLWAYTKPIIANATNKITRPAVIAFAHCTSESPSSNLWTTSKFVTLGVNQALESPFGTKSLNDQ